MMNWKTIAILFAVLLAGGCPEPLPTGDVADTSESDIPDTSEWTIPGGTYSGDITHAMFDYLNGDIILSDTGTEHGFKSFSNDGIPLAASGEPERPGLIAILESETSTLTSVTESVTVRGNQVTVVYADTLFFPDHETFGAVTWTGTTETFYTLTSEGSVEYYLAMLWVSEYLPGYGIASMSQEESGILRR